MSSYDDPGYDDTSDDGPDDDELEQQQDDETPAAVIRVGSGPDVDFDDFSAAYNQAATPELRAEIWATLSAEDQDTMTQLGLQGPIHVEVDDLDVDIVYPGSEGYDHVMQRAASRVKATIADLASPDHRVDPNVAQRIRDLYEIAELGTAKSKGRAEAIQTADAIVERIVAARRGSVPFKTSMRRQFVGRDGRMMVEERDRNGRSRTTVLTDSDDWAFNKASIVDRPWGNNPTAVTNEDIASWPMETTLRFRDEHPQHWEYLKYQADLASTPHRRRAR